MFGCTQIITKDFQKMINRINISLDYPHYKQHFTKIPLLNNNLVKLLSFPERNTDFQFNAGIFMKINIKTYNYYHVRLINILFASHVLLLFYL